MSDVSDLSLACYEEVNDKLRTCFYEEVTRKLLPHTDVYCIDDIRRYGGCGMRMLHDEKSTSDVQRSESIVFPLATSTNDIALRARNVTLRN